jgi:hypothetical protein
MMEMQEKAAEVETGGDTAKKLNDEAAVPDAGEEEEHKFDNQPAQGEDKVADDLVAPARVQ